MSASHVHPQILRFEGSDLCLNRKEDIWLRVTGHPELVSWMGEEIIVSDGTGVLGTDNRPPSLSS